MTLILKAADGRDCVVNGWNWGVLHRVVELAGVFPDEVWGPKRSNGGGELDGAQVATLAGFLEREVLRFLEPGERLLANGEITNVPDDGTFHRDEDELWRNYSLHHSVLVDVIRFLREADGPVSFS